MEGWLLSFILACMSSLFWTTLPTPLLTTICFTVSLILLLRFSNSSLSTWTSGFFAGLVWISSVGHWYQYWQLQVDDFNQTVVIEGEISTLIATNSSIDHLAHRNQRFNVRITSIDGQSTYIAPYNFRLSWHSPDWILKQGQRVQLLVKVKPSHGLANEGGFHYQQWLFSQKIQATGYVKPSDINALIEDRLSVRQHLLDNILSYGLDEERWLVALSLGYRGLLEKSDWYMLQVTGTAHLVAISGLHMAVVAALSYFMSFSLLNVLVLFRLLKANLPMRKMALIISLGFCLFYAYLAGFSVPTVRAWVMMFVVSTLMMLSQSWSKTQCLLVLMVVVILLFPLSLYGISFWLSFLAVIIILYSLWCFPIGVSKNRQWQKWVSTVRLQFVLSLFMFPLLVWQFSMLSISAPFINLIAVPLVTIFLVPISVASSFIALLSPQVAEYGFVLVDTLLEYCVGALGYLSDLPFSYIELVRPPAYVLGSLFVFLIIVFLPRLPVPRYLLFLWLFPLVAFFYEDEQEGWQVDVLDVGQGLSVLVSHDGSHILYDTGPSFPSGFNTADAAIIPLLKSRGIETIDLLIISHNDNDHAGGQSILLSAMNVKEVISSEDSCFNGWNRQFGELRFEALWPEAPMSADENESSCVVKVSDSHHSLLLTGDIDKRVERKLIKLHSDKLRSELIVVPHHGSNSSSSVAFIRQVSPRYAVFSQGFLNRWRFPRPEIVDRYANERVSMFSTSDAGQISFSFKSTQTNISLFREDKYPYWYANRVHADTTNGY